MNIPVLREHDYFSEKAEMHYALYTTVQNIAPWIHRHEFFEMVLILKGEIEHYVNGHKIVLREGSLTFIRPNDAHFFKATRKKYCHLVNLAVTASAVNKLFDYLGDKNNKKSLLEPVLPVTATLSRQIKELLQTKLESLNNISIQEIEEKRTRLRILLFELVTQYFLINAFVGQERSPKWLQHACSEMSKLENLAMGLDKMQSLSGVSHEHLSRSMRQSMNQTPTAYIKELRLNYAANSLIQGDKAIIAIMADVGFESLSYFYKIFKEQYGLTPKQFRVKYKPNLLEPKENK